MSTKWSKRLLFCAICVSSLEILAVLYVAKVSAAADIPKEIRSRNRLSRETISYSGSAASMLEKSLSLSSRQDLLISDTSSTCVLNGSGHLSM